MRPKSQFGYDRMQIEAMAKWFKDRADILDLVIFKPHNDEGISLGASIEWTQTPSAERI